MTLQETLLILGMALATFATRYPILALVSRIDLPPALFATLKFIPPAVLTAIILPTLVIPDGKAPNFALTNVYWVAGVVTFIASWRTKNLLLTLAIGMIAFWGWRALIPLLGIH